MKTFIDISSDKIGIYGFNTPLFLERNNVDKELGKVLVELDKKYGITECLVLNGPGGFTNLRVGTLALNLLKTLKKDTITFYSISKPELYSLFHKNGWIPRYGILYIGQKSNVWLRDTDNSQLIKMIKKNEHHEIKNEFGEYFLDQVYDENYFQESNEKISYSYNNGELIFNGDEQKKIKRDKLIFHEVEKLEANYMIEPNIS